MNVISGNHGFRGFSLAVSQSLLLFFLLFAGRLSALGEVSSFETRNFRIHCANAAAGQVLAGVMETSLWNAHRLWLPKKIPKTWVATRCEVVLDSDVFVGEAGEKLSTGSCGFDPKTEVIRCRMARPGYCTIRRAEVARLVAGDSSDGVPTWAVEGLVALCDSARDEARVVALAQTKTAEAAPTARQVIRGNASQIDTKDTYLVASLVLVRLFQEELGTPLEFARFLKLAVGGKAWASALKIVYGLSPDQLEERYQNSLARLRDGHSGNESSIQKPSAADLPTPP